MPKTPSMQVTGAAYPNRVGVMAGGGITPSGFTMASVSGLMTWYDFSDPSTLFTDTSRTTPVSADEDMAKGVTDKRGTFHLSEATNGPLYDMEVANARAGLRFNGTSAVLLAGSAMSVAVPYTVVWVSKLADTPFGRTVWSQGAGGGAPRVNTQVSNNWIAEVGGALSTPSNAATTAGQVHVLVVDNATSEWRINGVAQADTDSSPSVGLSQAMRVGHGGNGFFNGHIFEFGVFNRAISETDRDLLEAALGKKFGITVI